MRYGKGSCRQWQWSFQWGLVVTGKGWWLRSDGGGGAADGNVREVCAWACGVITVGLCECGGYKGYFLHKKSRASHVCKAPSEVNDENGRMG
jgi:hypothetical protein